MAKALHIIVKRFNMPASASYTIGRLYANSIIVSDTIEDRDRGLTDSMPLTQIKAKKIYGETAIPKGTYTVVGTVSPKFKNRVWAKKYNGIVPEIIGVKGFSGIRIHPANTAAELLGCIAPGQNKVKGKVINSTTAFYKFMDTWFMPALKNKLPITITIE
jgi:hypothetical protein